MKAIKIASGVAISALAAAISVQAHADAESTVKFSGDLRVQTVVDLENEKQTHEMPGRYAPGSEDWFNFNADTTVTHGPFSGKLRIGIHEDQVGGGTNGNVTVRDLRVVEGPISFGQIGRITDTAGVYEGLTEELYFYDSVVGDPDEDTRVGVDYAFRYTLADFGVRVQAEGNAGHPFGFAAAIHQDFDVAQVWADAQFRQAPEPAGTDGMQDAETTFGAAIKVTPIDMLALTAVVRNTSADPIGAADDRTVYSVKGEVSVTDSISVYAMIVDNDAGEDTDSAYFRVGGSVGFNAITLQAHYEARTAEAADALIHARVSYAEGAIGAFADVKQAQQGYASGAVAEDGIKFELGGSYTTDSGIKYEGVYANANDDWWAGVESKLTLRAQYSF